MAEPRLLEAADALYRALDLMPCACLRDFYRGTWIRTKACIRCKALEEWREVNSEEETA